jgi:hypothetical protein
MNVLKVVKAGARLALTWVQEGESYTVGTAGSGR